MTTSIKNSLVQEKFDQYPRHVLPKMLYMRKLILDTAQEDQNIGIVEETLKWGQPSYLARYGSTLRIDWIPNKPNQFAIYFNCNTQLIATFKMFFGKRFSYDKERAILFSLDEELPEKEIKTCIQCALLYHKLKHKKLLGL